MKSKLSLKQLRLLRQHLQKFRWLLIPIDVCLWLLCAAIIWLISPEFIWAVVMWFLCLFMATYILLWLIVKHRRRSLLITIALVGWVGLRFLGLDQWLNVVLLWGLLITIELLFHVK